jgi:hypothetical protein
MEVPSKLSKIWSDESPAIAVEAMHRSMRCPHRTERCGENCASGGRLASIAVMESTHQGQGSVSAAITTKTLPRRDCNVNPRRAELRRPTGDGSGDWVGRVIVICHLRNLVQVDCQHPNLRHSRVCDHLSMRR